MTRKTYLTESIELFRQRLDLRRPEHKKSWEVIQQQANAGNTKFISILRGLINLAESDDLHDILQVEPVDYQRNVPEGTACVCGQPIHKEVHRMRFKGKGMQGTEFFLGNVCFQNLPTLLSEFGYHELKEKVEGAKKRNEEVLEELVFQVSPSFRRELEVSPKLAEMLKKKGIDTEQFEKIRELLMDAPGLDDSSILFSLDPGTNRSFANWFREQVNSEGFDNQEIAEIYYRLVNAAHLIDEDDLAILAAYSYANRRFPKMAVIGGIQDDLEFLADTEKGREIAEEFGTKIDLDHDYEPYVVTRFDPGEKSGTYRQIFDDKDKDDTFMTMLKALNIKLAFPEIEKVRYETNRRRVVRYEPGKRFHDLLREVEQVFEQDRSKHAASYKKNKRPAHDAVLSQDDYNTVRRFLERSAMGYHRSERENYLRMFSIRQFRGILPAIVSIGRKIKADVKEECMLRESFDGQFAELTGIGSNDDNASHHDPATVIDMLANTAYVENKNLASFQENHAQRIAAMYEAGLVATRDTKKTGKSRQTVFERYFTLLQREKPAEISEETRKKLDELLEFMQNPFVIPSYDFEKAGKARFITENARTAIDSAHRFMSLVAPKLDHAEEDLVDFEKNRELCDKAGKSVIVWTDHKRLCTEALSYSSQRQGAIHFSYYDPKQVKATAEKLEGAIEADEDLDAKCRALGEYRSKEIIGEEYEGQYFSYFMGLNKSYKIFLTQEAKARVESLHKILAEYDAMDDVQKSAFNRRRRWKGYDAETKRRKADTLEKHVFERLVGDRKDIWEMINGTVGGYLKGPRGRKELVRFGNYEPRKPEQRFVQMTFSRFMSDGTRFADWTGLASGRQDEFSVDFRIKKYLLKDRQEGIINMTEYDSYAAALDSFEQDVNRIVHEGNIL